MENGIKEKFNIFKEVVGLLDNKLASTIIAILLVVVFIQASDNRRLSKENSDDKDKLYEMVIQEVRKQVKPIELKQDSATTVIKNTSDSVRNVIGDVKGTLNNINKNIKK